MAPYIRDEHEQAQDEHQKAKKNKREKVQTEGECDHKHIKVNLSFHKSERRY